MNLTKNAVFMVLAFVLLCTVSGLADDKPSVDLDWYGYVKLDASYDQNVTSHGNFVMWVNPKPFENDDQQYNMTANETRFGVKLNGHNYGEALIKGQIEFDLYAGVTGATIAENKAMLQLRHAYFSVGFGNFTILAGQSWDLISPLNPSTLNYPVLWGCGNIGYRRPQISASYKIQAAEQTSVTMAGGFFRTIGNDLTPTFTLAVGETSDGLDDGTDAAIPSLQGQLDINHKFANGGSLRVGGSGLWGQLKAETNQGNQETYESWGVVGHLAVSPSTNFGVMGEYYTGSNLGSYFGGILNTNRIDGLASQGAWGSAWVQPVPKVKLVAGYGFDDPEDEDISLGNRSKNQAVYGNIQYSPVSAVTFGVEVSNWKTEYLAGDTNETMRAQTSFKLNF